MLSASGVPRVSEADLSGREDGNVSFDIFFQRFDGGTANTDDVMAVLDPFVTGRGDGWLRLQTSDGGADVYIEDPGEGAMFNHAAGCGVWDVMYDFAVAGEFVVIPTGCGSFLFDERLRNQLPDGVPEPIVVVRSGADLLAGVEVS